MRSSSTRWLAGIALFAAALIITSVLLSVLLGDDAELLPADTPEGTVQRYIRALNEKDPITAYSYVSKDLEPDCTLQHFINTTEYITERGVGAELVRTTSVDGSRVVRVEITESRLDPPFGGGQYSFTVTFTLEQQDGEWRMTEPPWPMSWCPPQRETPAPVPTPQTALYGTSLQKPGHALAGGHFEWVS